MIMRRKFIKSAALALFLLGLPAGAESAELSRKESLQIVGEGGSSVSFTVEIAANDQERMTGLMNRETMPADHGMLFDFGQTRQVYMWMKDTYLPLDMLFIGQDGKISHIKENALPLDESIIDSHGPVRFVLELNAGVVHDRAIRQGQRVSSQAVDAVAGNGQ
jgi:uncharacterized membrane protein (UPF0127 family)